MYSLIFSIAAHQSTHNNLDIVTITLSCIALIISIATPFISGIVIPKYVRPKLKISIPNDYARLSKSEKKENGSSIFVRLKVENTGITAAQQCCVRLVEIRPKDKATKLVWDVSTLNWTGQSEPKPIYLSAKSDFSFVDVFQVVEQDETRKVDYVRITTSSTPNATDKKLPKPDTYYLRVIAYAERADPIQQWLEFKYEEEFNIDDPSATVKLSTVKNSSVP